MNEGKWKEIKERRNQLSQTGSWGGREKWSSDDIRVKWNQGLNLYQLESGPFSSYPNAAVYRNIIA